MRWLLVLIRVLLFRRDRPPGMVRPWALSAPVLVLLVALPLLRPIRHTDPRDVSDDELALLATTQALVEHDTPAIDQTQFFGTRRKFQRTDDGGTARWYADQPPVMAVLLSTGYRAMRYNGLTFRRDAPTVTYLLTLLGVALPAACAAGLVYRMGRLFELNRPRRALLAAAAVFATGLFSYATVLNAHVPPPRSCWRPPPATSTWRPPPSGHSPRSGCSAPGCAPRWRPSSTRRPSRSCRCWPASRSRSGGGRGCGSAACCCSWSGRPGRSRCTRA
jgi:hypothetical protein